MQLVLVHIICILSFLNPPDEEKDKDKKIKAPTRMIVGIIYFLLQTFLLTEMVDKPWQKVVILQVNIVVLWTVNIYELLSDGIDVTRSDIVTFCYGIFSTMMSTSFFSYVHKNIETLVMNKEISINELA